MWRPNGWENPHKRDNYLGRPETMRHIAFEAGADAMLGGLKKGAIMMVHEGQKIGYWPARPKGDNGWLVFIPEE